MHNEKRGAKAPRENSDTKAIEVEPIGFTNRQIATGKFVANNASFAGEQTNAVHFFNVVFKKMFINFYANFFHFKSFQEKGAEAPRKLF